MTSRPRPVTLGQLKGTFILDGPVNPVDPGWAGLAPGGVAADSREVRPGDLFIALPGRRAHGAASSASAVRAGACAVLTDRAGLESVGDLRVPILVKDGVTGMAATVAAALCGQPATRLGTLAVAGSHGAFSSAHMAHRILMAAGVATAEVAGDRIAGPEVQRALADAVARGATDAVVTLPERALRRGASVALRPGVAAVAALHATEPRALEEHLALVRDLLAGAGRRVILLDGDPGARLADEFDDAVLVGFEAAPHAHRATWRIAEVRLGPAGSSFVLLGPAGTRLPTTVARPGTLVVADAALALVSLREAGHLIVPPEVPLALPGRMEVIGREPTVVADRATGAAEVGRALASLPRQGAVRCVYPALAQVERGGRVALAQALADGADEIILTAPATPAGRAALAALRACFTPAEAGRVLEKDPHVALSVARSRSTPHDIVLVAAAGRETISRGPAPREGQRCG